MQNRLNAIDRKFKDAICRGKIDKINQLITEEKANVNATDANGNHPLNWLHGIRKKKLEEGACILLKHGADALAAGYDEDIPLIFLLKKKCYKAYKLFINECIPKNKLNNLKETLINYTLEYGDQESFKLLEEILEEDDYQNYFDCKTLKIPIVNKKYDYAIALLKKHFAKNLLTKEDDKQYFLREFIVSNNKDYIKFFVTEYKPDLNVEDESGNNILHFAVIEETVNAMDILLENNNIINTSNHDGDTPLMLSLRILLKNQYEFGLNELGYDPEYKLVVEDLVIIIKKLLAVGASTLIKNKNKTIVDLAKKLYYEVALKKTINKHAELETIAEEIFRDEDIFTSKQKAVLKDHIATQHRVHFNVDDDKCEAITAIQDDIAKKPYINYSQLKAYELIARLTKYQPDYRLDVKERHTKNSAREANAYYYTFLADKPYRLTEIDQKVEEKKIASHIIYQLMTTLVYKFNRNGELCQLHHKLIKKLDSKYKNYDAKKYRAEIAKYEEKEGDYFSENLSDNSDSDEEEKFQLLPNRKQVLLNSAAYPLYKQSQAEEKLLTQNGELVKTSAKYDRSRRQKIMHSKPVTDQAQRDLEKLNMLAITGQLNEKTIKTIQTKFFVAQYRGIGYRVDGWSQAARQQHRLMREEKLPQYSSAVLEEAGCKTFDTYYEKTQNSDGKVVEGFKNKLLNIAMHLQDQLLQLKNSGSVKVALIGQNAYYFDNALEALQDLYTKNYKGFHDKLKEFAVKFKNNEHKGNPILVNELTPAVFLSTNNQSNFFMSTSDTPEHALRYAYGDKYYEIYKEFRLRPRWRKDGRAERPYAGKTYISLHEPLELFTKTHHVVSLDQEGKIHIDNQTISERETSFMAYLPANRVIGHYVAKFPSFHGAYKQIYFEKYGLTKNFYNKFKIRLLDTKPHTKERKTIKKILTEHLVSYQEACLIEEARVTAEKQGGILIYRNTHGGFSLLPCQSNEPSNVNDPERKAAIDASVRAKQDKREQRKSKENPTTGFFTDTLKEYQFISNKTTLINSLTFLLKIPAQELINIHEQQRKAASIGTGFFRRSKEQCVMQSFNKNYAFLQHVANTYKKSIYLHSPDIAESKHHFAPNGAISENPIHLYYVGGEKFLAMQPKHLIADKDAKVDNNKVEGPAVGGKKKSPANKDEVKQDDQKRRKTNATQDVHTTGSNEPASSPTVAPAAAAASAFFPQPQTSQLESDDEVDTVANPTKKTPALKYR